MNERTMNDCYFSKETAERLPNESRRRAQLVAHVSEMNKRRDELQREIDGFLKSALFTELFTDEVNLNDERVQHYFSLLEEIDDLGVSISWANDDIKRLDAGETLADLYRKYFG